MGLCQKKGIEGYFVTGTDTDVGKTRVAIALMNWLKGRGKTVVGIKPVSSGGHLGAMGLENSDAVQLQEAASIELPYQLVNPFSYALPIAPHLAAEGDCLTVAGVVEACRPAIAVEGVNAVVIEGAGGWLVPLNDAETMADLACACRLPVILVVAMRLGCLNHAMLTMESMQARGVPIAGWVANCMTPQFTHVDENIMTLVKQFSIPLLARVPYEPQPDSLIAPSVDFALA